MSSSGEISTQNHHMTSTFSAKTFREYANPRSRYETVADPTPCLPRREGESAPQRADPPAAAAQAIPASLTVTLEQSQLGGGGTRRIAAVSQFDICVRAADQQTEARMGTHGVQLGPRESIRSVSQRRLQERTVG